MGVGSGKKSGLALFFFELYQRERLGVFLGFPSPIHAMGYESAVE